MVGTLLVVGSVSASIGLGLLLAKLCISVMLSLVPALGRVTGVRPPE